jgi:hypothetical protein
MKVCNQILYSVLAILILLSTMHAISEEKLEEHMKTTWRMQLQLNMPNLEPAAIQWAILEEDPIPGYRQRLEVVRDAYKKLLVEAAKEDKQIIKRSQMRAAWDSGFRQVTGDRVYLLTGKPGHSFSSNGDAGMKWIVTKVIYVDEEAVCWVIPIDVEIGKSVDIEFSNDNVFDLTEIYNDIMSK